MWFCFHYSGLMVRALWMLPHEICFRERNVLRTLKLFFVILLFLSNQSQKTYSLLNLNIAPTYLGERFNRDFLFVRSGPMFIKLCKLRSKKC